MSISKVGIEDNEAEDAWKRPVIEALRGIRFGSVEIVIHDGRIVQIERREKVRLDQAEKRRPDDRG